MKITQVEWLPVAKASMREYGRDDVGGLAAEMAYWIVFSLFPFFAFLTTLAAIIGQAIGSDQFVNNAVNSLLAQAPQSTRDVVKGPLSTLLQPSSGALTFGAIIAALLALNSASAAVNTIIKAFNRAYGIEETRNFILKKLLSVALTLILVVLVVGGALLMSLSGTLVRWLHLGAAGGLALRVGTYVGPIIAINLALAILYWLGPNIKQSFQFVSPGSILATIALIVFSLVFGFYVIKFGQSSYNKTYGAFAGVILFLFFLRLASTIILLGAEFNAEAAKRYDPETIRDKITDPRKQIPGEQPQPHPQAAREAGVTPAQVARSNRPNGAAGQTAAIQRANGAAQYTPDGDVDLDIAARLRALREQPFASAAARAHDEQARLSSAERAHRARATFAALAVSGAAAVGGVVVGTLRRVRG
jgi:membrane protein